MTDPNVILNDGGAPLSSAEVDRIQAEATILGYELALTSHDPVAVDVVLRSAREEIGAPHFKHVTAEALRHVTVNVIAPMVEVAQANGLDHTDTIAYAVRNARDTLDHLRAAPDADQGAPSASVSHLPIRQASTKGQFYPEARPFKGESFDTETDPEHPSVDGGQRLVVARHLHMLHHDQSETFDHVPITATFQEYMGEQIEFGPWSMSLQDARLMAQSLLTLVSLVDGRTSASLLTTTPISTADYLAELAKDDERPDLRIVEDLP